MFRSAFGKAKDWLLKEEKPEPRRAPRRSEPEVVVHYWDGSAPEGRHLRDISESGAYIYTPERWYLGTIVRVVLQGNTNKIQPDGTMAPAASVCIPALVVRHGGDGVAVEFVFRDRKEEETFRAFLASIPAQPLRVDAQSSSAPSPPGREGQALIEFALIVPLVLLLAINAVNFGGFFFAWVTVANASRTGAQYMAMSSTSPGSPAPATYDQIFAVVSSDISSLLNRVSLDVTTCTNQTASPGGCVCTNKTAPAAACALVDPEAPTYTLATVDVTYTYKPFIPLFSFPGLGISATLPPGKIHRRAVMRMLQ